MSFIDECGHALKEAQRLSFEQPSSGIAHHLADEALLKLVRNLAVYCKMPQLDTLADMYNGILKYHDDTKRMF